MKHIITYMFIALVFIGIAIAGGAVEIGGGLEKPIRTIPISTDTADKYQEVHGVALTDDDIKTITEEKINEEYMTRLKNNISMKLTVYYREGTPLMLKRLDNCLKLAETTR